MNKKLECERKLVTKSCSDAVEDDVFPIGLE